VRNSVAALANYVALGEIHEFNQAGYKDIGIGFALTVDIFSGD